MEGPIRLGQRTLSIEFKSDRYAQDRIGKAYCRLEMLAADDSPLDDSVQVAEVVPLAAVANAPEIQG